MRRTTPDLSGSRQRVYRDVSIGLLTVTIAYVLWANYVVFVGGNLPLTPISLGGGSVGAGLFMLFIGDLILVIAAWFLIDGVLLNVVHMLLQAGSRQRSTTIEPQPPAGQPQQQGQQWQGQGQPQPWQGQPQQWQGQPQQWQGQQWESQQWQPQPGSAPPAAPPAGANGSSQATLTAPPSGWSPPPQR
jgi:hypothetical protein